MEKEVFSLLFSPHRRVLAAEVRAEGVMREGGFSLLFSTTGEYYLLLPTIAGEYYLQKFGQKVWCEMEKEVFSILFSTGEYHLQKFGQKVYCEINLLRIKEVFQDGEGRFSRWRMRFFHYFFPRQESTTCRSSARRCGVRWRRRFLWMEKEVFLDGQRGF